MLQLAALFPMALRPGAMARAATPYEQRLRAALADLPLPQGPSRLELIRFEGPTSVHGALRMRAVVRLRWPPGTRQCRFEARGQQSELIFARLVADIEIFLLSLV